MPLGPEKLQKLRKLVEQAWKNATANDYEDFIQGYSPDSVAVDMMDNEASIEKMVERDGITIQDVSRLVKELQDQALKGGTKS